jgi:hypothetical protein
MRQTLELVIPGRREATNPESITTIEGCGFRACALRRIYDAQLRIVE